MNPNPHSDPRPLHRRGPVLCLVWVGGVLGTLARWGLGLAFPARGGWPLGTLAANLPGAFCLGLLLEALARGGPDEGWLRRARLLVGTGFLGAFTTMSTLAVETVLLADARRRMLGLGYLSVSLLAGVVLAWLGILLGARLAGPAVGEGAR